MKEKELIYMMALEEVKKLHLDDYHTEFLAQMVTRKKLHLDDYHTEFLAQMVTRKVRHPKEHVDDIAKKVMEKMPMIFMKKKKIMLVSTDKCLDELEMLLESSEYVPTEMLELGGENVSSVVKYFSKIVFEKLNAE